MIRLTLILTAVLALSACGDAGKTGDQHQHDGHEHDGHQHDDKKATAITKNEASAELLDAYLKIKNGLADDNPKVALEVGPQLQAALQTVKDQDSTLAPTIESLNEHIAGMNTKEIATQREHFEKMTKPMQTVLSRFGSDRELYVQHCPMYKENGGSWISDKNEVVNPLFGSQMLHCGEVTEQLVVK